MNVYVLTNRSEYGYGSGYFGVEGVYATLEAAQEQMKSLAEDDVDCFLGDWKETYETKEEAIECELDSVNINERKAQVIVVDGRREEIYEIFSCGVRG